MMRGIERVRRYALRLGNRSTHKAFILLYHRIARLDSDPWALAVTPRRFAEHLEVLREYARPIRLRHLSRVLREGTIPDRSVVITFDDGYMDNLHSAKPLLKHHEVPATIFVPSGFVDSEQEFWWDELDRLLLHPGTLPQELRVSVNGNEHQWNLGEAAHYGEEESRYYRRWRAWSKAPTPRHFLYRSLWDLLHPMAEEERRRVLAELWEWAGIEPSSCPDRKSLSAEELVALSRGGLIEIGAHTVTHPSLSSLPVDSQRYEIQESKARLEEILSSPVTSFAYPYGQRSDYTADTVDIVREAGFACACANFAGSVERSTDSFQMPRVFAQNWDRDGIAKRLSSWFDG